jgi:hypothetical protein
VGADLLGGFAGVVPMDDVIDVGGEQKALRSRGSATGRWSLGCFVDAFTQFRPSFTEVAEVRGSSY